MEDPGLGGNGGVFVDGQRAAPGHFVNHLDREVAGLETSAQTVAKGGLAHAVATDESEFVVDGRRHV
jgi:hypothetical protein